MFERIIEIIVYVISELQGKKSISDIDVQELKSLGYTNSEISTAFSWLVDRAELSQQLFSEEKPTRSQSFRVMHEAEEDLFTKEAYGELIQMQTLGILNNEQIEALIEKSMMSGWLQIDKKHLIKYIATTIFADNSETRFGSRVMLDGSDTIN